MGVLEERAEVVKAIAGRTVADAVLETATRHPDAPAFTQDEETLTWSEARERVLRIAAAFTALGLEPGETVALMMPNRTERVLADLGVVPAGGVPNQPSAHIADRVLSIYLPVLRVTHIHFCPDPARRAATLARARPHGFFGVPRVWEKMMAAIQAVLAAEPDESRRAAVAAAMDAGRAYVESCEYGRTTTPEVLEAFRRADETVLAPMRALIGLDRVRHTV